MAGAYALFANGGFQVKPYFISRIENGNGEVVFTANPPRACLNYWARYRRDLGPETDRRPSRRADTGPGSGVRDNIHDAGRHQAWDRTQGPEART